MNDLNKDDFILILFYYFLSYIMFAKITARLKRNLAQIALMDYSK